MKRLPESIKSFLRSYGNEIEDDIIDLDKPRYDGLPILHQLVVQALSDPIDDPDSLINSFYASLFTTAADTCKELLDLGADVNSLDENGLTPLRWAVVTNNWRVIKVLIDYGARAYFTDPAGRTIRETALEQFSRGLLSKTSLNLIMSSSV